jgi:hypothetical protein
MSVLITLAMIFSKQIGSERGMYVGYTSMVLSFLLVYFGIRSYRDNAGGVITFGRAVGLGLAITAISCVCYVVAWEILYHFFMPNYFDNYIAHALENARAAGASPAALAAKTAQLEKMKAIYANFFAGAAMTFLEPFPVGLFITLISAAALRKKPGTRSAQQTATA